MPGIMADNDSRGHWAVMYALLQSETYRDFWKEAGIAVVEFEKLGLPDGAPDVDIWRACQEREIVLLTGNRNAESADSLENTIRAYNDASCFPVITIANPQRLIRSKTYAQRVVERLLDYLLNLDNYRGAGRLYVP
jgi:hypothetical protein